MCHTVRTVACAVLVYGRAVHRPPLTHSLTHSHTHTHTHTHTGDVPVNTFDLKKSVEIIERHFSEHILPYDCIPLTLGGDHTIVLPILRAMAKKHGPVGLIHVDAHADTNEMMFGEEIAHGTPFRRAVEEGLLDCDRVVQIGLRGTG